MDRQRGVLRSSARGGSTDGLSGRIRSVLALAAGNQNLYVAVGREVKVYKQVLAWALRNNPAADRLVLLHVHCPSPLIPVDLGGWFSPNQVSEHKVKLYRQQESEKVDEIMNEYMLFCGNSKVQADKLVLEMDDVAKGILKAIEQNGITKLVMGTSVYSRKTKSPRSKIAQAVWKEAPAPCNIWIVNKGDLLKIREAVESSIATSSSHSTWEGESEIDAELDISDESDREPELSPVKDQTADLQAEKVLYRQIQKAQEEAAKFRDLAHEESSKLSGAQIELVDARLKAKQMERKYEKMKKVRKQLEEAVAREQLETEKLRSHKNDILQALKLSTQQQSALADKIAVIKADTKNLKTNLLEAQNIISSLEQQIKELQEERNNAVLPPYSEFTYTELQKVTQNFESSFIIGEGAYGCVYKAFLRHTEVAIKVLNPDSLQGQSEFLQEVIVLSRVRHPHLIALIGACREKFALVYEFLPNGCLKDRLECKGNTPPLSWQARIRIIAEICSALIFLHSSYPQAVVHGDLKPANILLDANLISKLGDFGISRLLLQSNAKTTLFHQTIPKGTPVYMDPLFLSTGELTPSSDVYSFGIVLLQLMTGRSAVGIARHVKNAVDNGNLHQILDHTAGDWPYGDAVQLAQLGVRCCEVDRSSRPDLQNDVWRFLEPLKRVYVPTKLSTSLLSLESSGDVPSYFYCPIFHEIMQDPQMAADGYTYEAEAIKGWLKGGRNASPMTNKKLPNMNLVPNLALRSAIQEWLQKRRH